VLTKFYFCIVRGSTLSVTLAKANIVKYSSKKIEIETKQYFVATCRPVIERRRFEPTIVYSGGRRDDHYAAHVFNTTFTVLRKTLVVGTANKINIFSSFV
jgi:hypothetical protein